MGFVVKKCFRRVYMWQNAFARFLLVGCILLVCIFFACFAPYSSIRFVSAQNPRPFRSSPSRVANINIIEANNGGQNFQVGQQIDSVLSVQGVVKPVTDAHSITVIDMLPAGLADLSSMGAHWHITLSASSSPATLIAVYSGPYPLTPESILPPIILSGIFTASAVPGVASSILLGTVDSSRALRIVSTYTVHISVHCSINSPHPLPSPDAIFYPGLPHTGY